MIKCQLHHACFFLVAAVVFRSKLPLWLLLSAGLLVIFNPATVGGKLVQAAAVLQGRHRHETVAREDDRGQGPTVTKTKICSISFQSVSPRLTLRGIELRLSDGVIARVGKVSFGFRRLKQMIRWQPLQKGKGKAIVVTVENAKVLLPASFLEQSSTAKATSSGRKGSINNKGLEKAISLPAAAQLFARFVAIEICDLRVELAANQADDNSSNGIANSGGGDRAPHGSDGAYAATATSAAPATAGVRAMELVGVRLVGFVSRGSSCLTVSIENMIRLTALVYVYSKVRCNRPPVFSKMMCTPSILDAHGVTSTRRTLKTCQFVCKFG